MDKRHSTYLVLGNAREAKRSSELSNRGGGIVRTKETTRHPIHVNLESTLRQCSLPSNGTSSTPHGNEKCTVSIIPLDPLQLIDIDTPNTSWNPTSQPDHEPYLRGHGVSRDI